MTSRGLCSAHVPLMAFESFAASTSKLALSRTFLRTSASLGSRDTTRILSFPVIHIMGCDCWSHRLLLTNLRDCQLICKGPICSPVSLNFFWEEWIDDCAAS